MPRTPDCIIIWDGRARAELTIALTFNESDKAVFAAVRRAEGELNGAVFLASEVGIEHAFAPELDFTQKYRSVLYPFIDKMKEISLEPNAGVYVACIDQFTDDLFQVNSEFSYAVEEYFEKKFGGHKTHGRSEE